MNLRKIKIKIIWFLFKTFKIKKIIMNYITFRVERGDQKSIVMLKLELIKTLRKYSNLYITLKESKDIIDKFIPTRVYYNNLKLGVK